MTELKHIFVEELINALDNIQEDIPEILNYYIDNDISKEDGINISIDLLAMNLLNLRDSANMARQVINLEIQKAQAEKTKSDEPNMTHVKKTALALFFHMHMLTDPESIYYSNILCNQNSFGDEIPEFNNSVN